MTTSDYQENPIRSTVQQMLNMRSMKEFSTVALAENDSGAFARDKIFAVLQTLGDLLEKTPAELASVSGMSTINNHLQAPMAEMVNFVGNANPGHLINAASQLEQNVMPYFWAFTPALPKLASTTLPALLKSQTEFSHSAIRGLSEQRDQLAKNLDASIEKSETLTKKLDDANETAARERAESATAVAKLEQLFAQAEGARQIAFDTAVAEQQRLHKEQMDLEASVAKETLAELGAFRDDAARIVQVVGNIGVTGNYQRIANAEAESANFWRWVTLLIFGAGIGIAIATFIKFWHDPFSQDTAISVLIRLFYAIVITSPAIYTARESARHRTNADRARQTELELASIGPFIELLPEDSKVAIRTGLTSSYFGRTTDAHTVSSPLDPEHFKNFVEVLKAVKPK
jgi:hypothetical protein